MKKIKVNDVELAYRDEGSGHPIVFLHAFPVTQRMWDGQLAALAPAYRVITFDWRGFGESALGERAASMDIFADDLAGLMGALQIERAAVCGLSMGGYAALAFYRKYAARVAALILADTRAGADAEEAKRARYEISDQVLREGLSKLPDQLLPKLLAPDTPTLQPQVAEQVRAMIVNNQAEGVVRAQAAMAERTDSAPLFDKINCPTLVIVGEKDTLTPPSEAEKMRVGIPGAQLKIIPAAGHLSNLERPDAFNQTLSEFLNIVFSRS
jgi:3-oxoadipate enol-lactonase